MFGIKVQKYIQFEKIKKKSMLYNLICSYTTKYCKLAEWYFVIKIRNWVRLTLLCMKGIDLLEKTGQ